jgi:hypothetical protein
MPLRSGRHAGYAEADPESGLRYDYESPRHERFNRLSFFLPQRAEPVGPAVGPPIIIRRIGCGRGYEAGLIGSQQLREARFGFAYNVMPKTVLRGGYGITYLPSTI